MPSDPQTQPRPSHTGSSLQAGWLSMNLSSCLRKTICPPALKVALQNMLPLLADSVFLLGHAPIHASLWMELQPFVLGLVVRIQEVCGLEWGKKNHIFILTNSYLKLSFLSVWLQAADHRNIANHSSTCNFVTSTHIGPSSR